MSEEKTKLTLPNLIIAGVHKAGTSSVFTYLSLHPEVCASDVKEIGFFMPLKFGRAIPPMSEYAAHFSHCNSKKKYVLEASPSYLYGSEKIGKVLQQELTDLKLVVILRNPTERLISFYKHEYNNGFLPKEESFRKFVEKSIPYLKTPDIDKTPENEMYLRGVEEGMYNHYLPYWFSAFGKNLKVIFFEDLQKDTPGFMKELCAWLGIDFSIYKPADFKIDNKTTAYKSRVLHSFIYGMYMKSESFWRRNVKFKRNLRSIYKFIFASTSKDEIYDDDYGFAHSLYTEPNKELKKLLLQNGITHLPAWLD